MAETRPPAELARHSFHWLRQRDSLPQVWEWLNHGWLRTGDGFRVTPEAMHERGWRYDKPCLYDAAPLAEAERAVVVAAKAWRRAYPAIGSLSAGHALADELDRLAARRVPDSMAGNLHRGMPTETTGSQVMTDALRDAVRATCPLMECLYPNCHASNCNVRRADAPLILAALAPHTEAEIAQRVAEAVAAERAAIVARLADIDPPRSATTVHALWWDAAVKNIAAIIEARSEPR